MKKLPVVSIFLLVAVAVAAFQFGKRAQQPTPVREESHEEKGKGLELTEESRKLAGIVTANVRYDTVRDLVQATGEVVPNGNKVVKVGSFVAGRLSQLTTNIGDEVKAGQTIATVDSTDVAQARANYEQTQAELANAQRKLANTQRLAKSGVFTQKSVEEAREKRNEVASQLATLRVDYESESGNAEAGMKTAQATFDRAENARKLTEQELGRRKALIAAGAVQYKPLEEARREMAESDKAERQARTQLRLADSNLDRAEKLFQVGTRSKRELEEAQAARDAAEADVRKAEEQMRIAKQALTREQRIFDEKIYANREVQQAETDLAQAEKVKTEAEAALSQAKRRLTLAQSSQKNRALDEMENRLAALESLLKRETSVAGASLYANKELQLAEAEVAQAKLKLLAAENAMRILRAVSPRPEDRATGAVPIIAPISGRILERPVNRGQMIKPEDTLFAILDLSTVWVNVRVYEKDIRAMRVGQPVDITTGAYPDDRFAGKVFYIGDTIDEKTRTLAVRCEIANPQRRLKPEMFVKARITVATSGRTMVVPDAAVQMEEGNSIVYVSVGKDKFEKRAVKLGRVSGGTHEVLAGLKAGEQVVTEGSFLVKSQDKKAEFGGGD